MSSRFRRYAFSIQLRDFFGKVLIARSTRLGTTRQAGQTFLDQSRPSLLITIVLLGPMCAAPVPTSPTFVFCYNSKVPLAGSARDIARKSSFLAAGSGLRMLRCVGCASARVEAEYLESAMSKGPKFGSTYFLRLPLNAAFRGCRCMHPGSFPTSKHVVVRGRGVRGDGRVVSPLCYFFEVYE